MFRKHRIRSLFLLSLTSRYFLIAIICLSKYFHLLSRLRRLRWRSSGVRTSFHLWLQAFCNRNAERRKFTLLKTQINWHYLTSQFSKTFLSTSKPINCPLNGEQHTGTSTHARSSMNHILQCQMREFLLPTFVAMTKKTSVSNVCDIILRHLGCRSAFLCCHYDNCYKCF